MAGRAFSADRRALQIGAPCIIEVAEAGRNTPVGLWWGKVIGEPTSASDRTVSLLARINDGPFAINPETREPIRTDEQYGVAPTGIHWVYPDTPTNRALLMMNSRLANEVTGLKQQLREVQEVLRRTQEILKKAEIRL